VNESTKFDLSTSEGGRGYLENLFQTQLKRHDFTNYIRVELAADFACALSQYIAPAQAEINAGLAREQVLREQLEPKTVRELLECNMIKNLSEKQLNDGLKQLHRENTDLRRHLHEAATSLETISKLAGRDEFMKHMSQVCGYANSRATVARAFMDQLAEVDNAPVVLPDSGPYGVELPAQTWDQIHQHAKELAECAKDSSDVTCELSESDINELISFAVELMRPKPAEEAAGDE
jgi:hypothetical protein